MLLTIKVDRQFEFLQQTWLSSPKFQGLRNEVDPIVGQGINPALIGKGQRPGFSIQTKNGDIQIEDFQSFVSMKGGGYFFLPGRDAIAFFANL